VDLKELTSEDVDWFHVAQDRVQWCVFVNSVMNFVFHKRQGISELAERCWLLKKDSDHEVITLSMSTPERKFPLHDFLRSHLFICRPMKGFVVHSFDVII
jgi:hypothetical protein